jgi:hypothetical protein
MYCYRFNSRNQFRTLAAAEGLITADNELITASHTHAIDEIGIITEGGTYDAEGNVITPPTPLTGWHVNYAGDPPEAWDQHLVIVNTASRVFFGGAAQAPDTATLEEMAA